MNGSTMEIVAITLGKEGGAGNGTASGNITSLALGHSFPNSGGVIQNYGVCLECHGATGKAGYTSAPRMFPYHALPKPGAYSSTDNTIGGGGWQNELDPSTPLAQFRGNVNWNAGATNSYFPIGKGRLNIGYAQHSLAAHATEDTYHAPNQSAPDTYQTMNAGISFGTVTHPTNSYTYFIPNFDATCTSSNGGCDNITGASTAVVGSRPATAYTVTATSSTGATLHVIYGGRHLGSFSSGGTFTLNVAQNYSGKLYQNLIPMDIFNSENGGPVWVVSEDGGAVNAGTWPGGDYANIDTIQTGLSYPGTDWPQQ